MKLSLKYKLMMIIVAVIAIPLVILGTISYINTANSIEKLVIEDLEHVSKAASEAINQEIDGIFRNIKIMSYRQDLIDITTGDLEKKASAFNYLSNLARENDDLILNLIVTDDTGKAIVTSDSLEPDLDLGGVLNIEESLAGAASISDILNSKVEEDKQIISLAYPLISGGQVTGVLTAGIKFENITKHVEGIEIGEKGYAFLIDKEGLVVSHPEKDKIMNENLMDTGSEELKSLIKKAQQGETGTGEYTYNGQKKNVNYVPIGKWIFSVTADYNEQMAAAYHIRRNVLITIILSLVISITIAYIFVNRGIIKPVRELHTLMDKVGGGDLTVSSNVKTGDEMEELSNGFNHMIRSQSKLVSTVIKDANNMQQSSEELAASIEEMTASTDQISSSVQNVAGVTVTQDESIVEISEVLVQLSSLIQIAQRRANLARENSKGTMDAATEGRVKIKEAVEAIENIRDVSVDTENILKSLSQVSERVSGIIETINGISDQTNLLALNANIELTRLNEVFNI